VRDGQVVARLPYVVRGRARLRVLTMPPFTGTLGPWVRRSEAANASRVVSRETELLGALEAALPRADVFSQQFSPTMLNALPFHWAGYRLEMRYTHRLEGLGSEQALWDGLRGNIRSDIRKARKRLVVRDDLGLDVFHDVWAKTFARQNLQAPGTLADLARIDAACAARDARAMLFGVDEAARVHAVAYAVWDDQSAFYLLGGGDPALRGSGATSLLIWELIMRARAVTDVFDFEGSMMEPVARFFRAFGGRQTPYLHVSRATARGRAALALRGGGRRLARVRAGSRLSADGSPRRAAR
jgi:Acetyltransferase (GNAT) domain